LFALPEAERGGKNSIRRKKRGKGAVSSRTINRGGVKGGGKKREQRKDILAGALNPLSRRKEGAKGGKKEEGGMTP